MPSDDPKEVITATGKLIFLASPYSHYDSVVRYERYAEVKAFLTRALLKKKNIYSPIVYTHPVHLLGAGSTTFEFWSDFNRAMLTRSSEMWILTIGGWEESKGIAYEIEVAIDYHVPIFLVNPQSHALSQYTHNRKV